MNRISLSMIGGVVIPILYYCAASFISFLIYISIGWEQLPGIAETLLFLPIGWTEMIYDKLFSTHIFSEFIVEYLLLTIIGNYILYFSLTYSFLHYHQIPRSANYTIVN
jgi:ABC-type Na+ efflux pump permease subunit